jgi:hypothetical protein
MSWEDWINSSFEITDEVLKDYFKFQYRGGHYTQMKREVIKYLRAKGYTTIRIAEIVYGNTKRHDAVVHHLKHSKNFHAQKLIEDNWRGWVKDGLYPIAKGLEVIKEKSYEYSQVNYELQKI